MCWQQQQYGMVVPYDITETIKKSLRNKYELKTRYNEPVKAPVKRGDAIGKLILIDNQGNEKEFPLVAKEDIEQIGMFQKFIANLRYLVLGNK